MRHLFYCFSGAAFMSMVADLKSEIPDWRLQIGDFKSQSASERANGSGAMLMRVSV